MILAPTTGIATGTLTEDFIHTVRSTGLPYCKVALTINPGTPDAVPLTLAGTQDFPFTYVPSWFFSYPLRKGDEITVYFFNGNIKYPVIFSVNRKYPDGILASNPTPPGTVFGGTITPPTLGDTFSFQYFTDKLYILSTGTSSDAQLYIHNEDSCLVVTSGKIYLRSTEIGLAGETFKVDAQHVSLTSNAVELIGTLTTLCTALSTFTTGLNPGTLVAQAGVMATAAAAAEAELTLFKG